MIEPGEYHRYRAEPPTTAYCPARLRLVRQEHQAVMQKLVACCSPRQLPVLAGQWLRL
ncbi:MAG: hypothetical protein JOZ18_14865 [Chloroflexi bacterium]|nr:hypothetical protein [Chloroflexota bacterium]